MHEILVVNNAIQGLILEKPSDEQISKKAKEDGMLTLRQSVLKMAYDGTISIEEALRLTE